MLKKSKKRDNNKKEIDEDVKRSKREKRMELVEEKEKPEEQTVQSEFDKELEQSRYAIRIE